MVHPISTPRSRPVRTASSQDVYLATTSWPDLLQMALDSEGPETELIEQVLRRTETKK